MQQKAVGFPVEVAVFHQYARACSLDTSIHKGFGNQMASEPVGPIKVGPPQEHAS